jgi:hypothetical protein
MKVKGCPVHKMLVGLLMVSPLACLAYAEFDFDYFGLERPGMEKRQFSPRVEGLEDRDLGSIQFTPDGNECYLTMRRGDVREVFLREKRDGVWSTPRPAPFVDGAASINGFSPDGNRLYFSAQPADHLAESGVYVRTRTVDGWSRAERLPGPVNLDEANRVIGMAVGAHEDLYFCTWRQPCLGQCDVWRAKYVNRTFPVTENLRVLNSSTSECMIIAGQNDRFVVFYSWRPGGYGQADLYASFPQGDTWTRPRNLGPRVNTAGGETPQTLSPDGRYLFFYSNSALLWIETRAILPVPDGPVFNLSSGQRFASIQTAVDYAQSGDCLLLSPGTYTENLTLPNIALTIRSANAQDAAVVSLTGAVGNGAAPVVTLASGTALRSLQGLTITGGMDGIVCPGARLQVSSCVITGHRGCGVEVSEESTLSLDHCIVAGNAGPGLRSVPKTTGRGLVKVSQVDVTQCTLVLNRSYGLEGDGITVINSILYGNGIAAGDVQIKGSSVKVSYSDIQGGFAGQSNLDADPLFVASGSWTDPNTYVLGDFHLKSKAGHWNPRTCSWVLDDVTSPCIDAGDPNAAFGLEPPPNGGRANLGAYGNTPEASRTAVE